MLDIKWLSQWLMFSRYCHLVSVMASDCLNSAIKHYQTQSITKCYKVLQSVTKYYKVLQSITKYYKVLQSITKYYRVLQRQI